LDTLNPSASVDEIAALERVIKRPLPDDVRESLVIHNGQPRQLTGFVFGLDLLDAERIACEWGIWAGLTTYNQEYRENMTSFPEGTIEPDYANPGWIPLTKSAGANYLGVDLAPGPAGSTGQVINFGRDENMKCVLAASWGEFLLSYAKFLESGALKTIHPEAKFWGDNFEPVFESVMDNGQYYHRHPHDTLIEWRKKGHWPLR
jgi:cell wall assembly regulator SMI1